MSALPCSSSLLCVIWCGGTDPSTNWDSPSEHCCIFIRAGSCVWKKRFSTVCLFYPSTTPLHDWSKISQGFHKPLFYKDWKDESHTVRCHPLCLPRLWNSTWGVCSRGRESIQRDRFGALLGWGQEVKASRAWTMAVTAEVCLNCWVLRANENAGSLATSPEILNWSIWGWPQII